MWVRALVWHVQQFFLLIVLFDSHLGSADYVMAEHVRAPSNGKIRFNEDLVHPTRTRHGHPAFLCYIDLYVTIELMHYPRLPEGTYFSFSDSLLLEFLIREEIFAWMAKIDLRLVEPSTYKFWHSL
jgi:hypothetical protein